ncbi:polymer-forming cytoskeletal protein [Thermovenabulum sp.]|uniref:polymer-forming cytoskeletal protein n=1 Tax=Thermovenabulum sp. TaxID=3100335 RepID=UPI003C7E961D
MKFKSLFFILLIFIFTIPSIVFANSNDRVNIGKDLYIKNDEVIYGSAVSIMGNVIVEGKVLKDAVAIMGDVVVRGRVDGDAVAIGGKVTIEPTGTVLGNTNEISLGNSINEIFRNLHKNNIYFGPGFAGSFYTNQLFFFKIMRLLGLLTLGIIVLAFFPNILGNIVESVDKSIGYNFLLGLAGLIITPIVIFLLVLSIIGIPLIPMVIIFISTAYFFGYIGICIFLGRKINEYIRANKNLFVEFIFGALVIWLLQYVPIAGFLINLFVFLLSIGLAIKTRFGTKRIPE